MRFLCAFGYLLNPTCTLHGKKSPKIKRSFRKSFSIIPKIDMSLEDSKDNLIQALYFNRYGHWPP